MPALIFCKRRWRIGSDDFVLPGIVEIVVRLAWLVLVTLLFIQHEQVTCVSGSLELRIYLAGVVTLLLVVIAMTVVLVAVSARGSVMDVQPRSSVATILWIRVFLAVPEVGWNLLGSIWIFTGRINCNDHAPLWILLKALLVVTWIALFVLVMTIVLLFEPMHRPHYDEQEAALRGAGSTYTLDTNMGSHYIQLWERRCRILCCANSKDETSLEALRNVADILASIFEDNELVASDIAAALVLLRLKQKYQDKREKRAISLKSRRNRQQLEGQQRLQEQQVQSSTIATIETQGKDQEELPQSKSLQDAAQQRDAPSVGSGGPAEEAAKGSMVSSKDPPSSSAAGTSGGTDDPCSREKLKVNFVATVGKSNSEPMVAAQSSNDVDSVTSAPTNSSKQRRIPRSISNQSLNVDGVTIAGLADSAADETFPGGLSLPCDEEAAEGVSPVCAVPPPHAWMTVSNARHFMKFSLASYGWPWYMYGRCCSTMGSMWPFLKCCTPCCCRTAPDSVYGDNCCLCHTAAMKAITGLEDEDFCYIHYYNNIYEVPFFVAIDDETTSIVVAIRGTMSLKDTITDMTAQTAPVYDLDGTCCSNAALCLAHKGMVQAACFVYDMLKKTQVLERAQAQYPSYRVVLTGHSLGAGAAVVLAARLKDDQQKLLEGARHQQQQQVAAATANSTTDRTCQQEDSEQQSEKVTNTKQTEAAAAAAAAVTEADTTNTTTTTAAATTSTSTSPNTSEQVREIICFAYSPPGGLCSLEFAQQTRDYVMSVVVGDDLVPRLSMHSLHNLRESILTVLQQCGQPKYRLLAQGCWFMLFGISESSLNKGFNEVHGDSQRRRREGRMSREEEEGMVTQAGGVSGSIGGGSVVESVPPSPSSSQPLLSNVSSQPMRNYESTESISDSASAASFSTLQAVLSNNHQQQQQEPPASLPPISLIPDEATATGAPCSERQQQQQRRPTHTPRHTETALCLPGHVLLVRPASIKMPHRWRVQWQEPCYFKELVISPWMMRHHLPHEVMAALDFVMDNDRCPRLS